MSPVHLDTRSDSSYCLSISGPMTFEVRPLLEEQIISAMRRYQQLEFDLTGVSRIDLFGVHLLGMLRGMGAVVRSSQVVEEAMQRLLCGADQRFSLGMRHRRQAEDSAEASTEPR